MEELSPSLCLSLRLSITLPFKYINRLFKYKLPWCPAALRSSDDTAHMLWSLSQVTHKAPVSLAVTCQSIPCVFKAHVFPKALERQEENPSQTGRSMSSEHARICSQVLGFCQSAMQRLGYRGHWQPCRGAIWYVGVSSHWDRKESGRDFLCI